MIRARPGGLLRRLLLFILLFSLCFTVLASTVQLYFEYRREMRDIDSRMELIRAGYLASLERSLWDLNQEQLNVQLRGLVDFSDVARVHLISPDFDLLQGNPDPIGPLRIERFELDYQPPTGPSRHLGQLEVSTDLGAVHQRLFATGLTSLLWMSVFLCGLAVALSGLFYRLVTRHLQVMAEFARRIAAGDWHEPLHLDKRRTLTKTKSTPWPMRWTICAGRFSVTLTAAKPIGWPCKTIAMNCSGWSSVAPPA